MLDLMNMKPEKKIFAILFNTQAYRLRCSSRKASSKTRMAKDFLTLLRIQQGKVLRAAYF